MKISWIHPLLLISTGFFHRYVYFYKKSSKSNGSDNLEDYSFRILKYIFFFVHFFFIFKALAIKFDSVLIHQVGCLLEMHVTACPSLNFVLNQLAPLQSIGRNVTNCINEVTQDLSQTNIRQITLLCECIFLKLFLGAYINRNCKCMDFKRGYI